MSRRRPPEPSLPERVRQTVRARSLFTSGDGVVVAVSGGPDSLALLDVLHALGPEWSLRLVVAHLDHGIRPDAAEDAAFVAEMAAQLGLPSAIGCADVPAIARAQRLSLEEAGREARYDFLARTAREHGCDRITTGHTADDRVETVLLNLARGTGLDGLAGIPACRPLSAGVTQVAVVRPLIDCWRREVLAYCAKRGLSPRHDVTNDLPDPTRNRIRRELLPWLERELSPAIKSRLLRLASLVEEEGALLRGVARELLVRATLSRSETELRLDAEVLAAAPPALARRALREAIRELYGELRALDWESSDALLRLARGELCTAITLPESGITAARRGPTLLLRKALEPPMNADVRR
jgi:tRNA(Ile)-lysidine synthase